MDGGPFRSRQPADPRMASRQEAVRRQPEPVQQPARVEPPVSAAPQKQVRHMSDSSKSSRSPWYFIVPGLVVLIGLGLVWYMNQASALPVDKTKYQAVFFTNGQVYFGKLKSINRENLQMTDIYYLQTQATGESESKNLQETSSDKNDVQLIKLGDEIHGPEDMMVISKDQVLFYENLKTDGKVAQSIEKHKAAQR